MNAVFDEWRETSGRKLDGLKSGSHPKEVISNLSEDLLAHYSGKPLTDPYDVYQHLMDYWAESMQDDCYIIAADGWKAEPYRVLETDKKGKEKDKGWARDLVPKELIVARYFAKEISTIEKLQAELEAVTSQLTELEEEHGGDEGLFSELDKVNKGTVNARLKEIKGDSDATDEADVFSRWLKLNSQETDLKKSLKDSEAALDFKTLAQYPKLSAAEIKTLVVNDNGSPPSRRSYTPTWNASAMLSLSA